MFISQFTLASYGPFYFGERRNLPRPFPIFLQNQDDYQDTIPTGMRHRLTSLLFTRRRRDQGGVSRSQRRRTNVVTQGTLNRILHAMRTTRRRENGIRNPIRRRHSPRITNTRVSNYRRHTRQYHGSALRRRARKDTKRRVNRINHTGRRTQRRANFPSPHPTNTRTLRRTLNGSPTRSRLLHRARRHRTRGRTRSTRHELRLTVLKRPRRRLNVRTMAGRRRQVRSRRRPIRGTTAPTTRRMRLANTTRGSRHRRRTRHLLRNTRRMKIRPFRIRPGRRRYGRGRVKYRRRTTRGRRLKWGTRTSKVLYTRAFRRGGVLLGLDNSVLACFTKGEGFLTFSTRTGGLGGDISGAQTM